MLYGLIGDVHANLQAFEEALKHLRAAGVDKILNVGDLVGYGGSPAEVLALAREQVHMVSIAGNHDRQAAGSCDPRMRLTATKALEWTRDNLSPAGLRYLSGLPEGQVVDGRLIMVHGSLVERDAYILTAGEVKRNLECMLREFRQHRICIFGHTHVPMLISTRGVLADLRETRSYQLERDGIYMINPGSVGQPRDRCPLCAFALLNDADFTVTFVRKPYDVVAAQRVIVQAGLPEKFARRLSAGV
jgi:predicted phosphodiesterase